jgi:hypothetical protein
MHARLLSLLLCTLCLGCGGKFGRGAQAFEHDREPLISLIPRGPRWIVQARPRLLGEQEAARVLWRTLVTEEREQAFVERTGVDPMRVEELVAIELPPSGYLLLVRGPFSATSVVERAGERLAIVDVRAEAPIVRREGLAGQGRYAYAALGESALLVAKDAPPQLVAEVLARLASRDTAGALEGADARALYTEHAQSPLVLFAPEPLALEPGSNVALLFARERALAVSARPTHAAVAVAIDMRGEFPPGAENNFRALARSLASAQLGRALGLSRVPDTMAVRVDAQGTFVTFALEATELTAGLRMLFFDDLKQLFGS